MIQHNFAFQVLGIMINLMGKVHGHILMVTSLKANSLMEKEKERVNIHTVLVRREKTSIKMINWWKTRLLEPEI